MFRSDKRISIKFTVGGMFLLATLLTAMVAISLQFHFSKQIATDNALARYSAMSQSVSTYIRNLDMDASSTAKLLAHIGSSGKYKNSEQDVRKILAEAMKNNPLFYSIYIANQDDGFYQLVNLESSPVVREKIKALPQDRWVLIKIYGEGEQRVKESLFYDEEFTLRHSTSERSNYFPSQRPWYDSASVDKVFKSNPYLFQHLKITGQTFSIKVPNINTVLGLDIVLSSVSTQMVNSTLGQASLSGKEAYIYKSTGEIIASNQGKQTEAELPASSELVLSEEEKALISQTRPLKISNQLAWTPIDYAIAGEPRGYSIDILNMVSEMTGLQFEYINGFSWAQLVEQYRTGKIDVLHSLLNTESNAELGHFSLPMYQLPFGILTKHNHEPITDLSYLNGKKLAILGGWSIIPELKKNYPQMTIVTFDSVKEAIEAVLSGEADAVIDSDVILKHTVKQYFMNGLTYHDGIEELNTSYRPDFHLAMKESDKALVAIIDKAFLNISEEQKAELENKWFTNSSQATRNQQNLVVPYVELFEFAKDEKLQNQLIEREIEGVKKYFFVSAVNQDEYFAAIIPNYIVYASVKEKVFTSIAATAILMACLLPVAWVFGSPIVTPIRALRAETLKIKQRDYDAVELVDTRIKEVWELSSSIVDMSQELKRHEKAQEEFVEAFIRLIAQAIDDKSPYTAGHCNRVPELGLMLSDAAEQSDSGPFASFKFATQDERREFRIAAWLHDCGKITTPEHIVDKGSKLEANYNRIHEIRMRFEVLWREAEIEFLKKVHTEPEHEELWRQQRDQTQSQLQDDFAFIAASNVGQEFMDEESKARIRQISEQTWLRYFDDTVGLSPVEELSKPTSTATLPVKEQLLSDKPEHIIKRTRNTDYDPKYGIKMEIPEHQYNLGEVYNLSIGRGTLTAEDRFKINEHMISTIKMLENLPFPPELQRVPRYASTHHETIKGTGYPRKLTGDQLSIPEKILVVADIFEALTASDRPYKKAKPISVAVDIMHKMALDEHIDMDVFKLFVQSETHVRYAKAYLKPEQIDSVDVTKYLEPKGFKTQCSERRAKVSI